MSNKGVYKTVLATQCLLTIWFNKNKKLMYIYVLPMFLIKSNVTQDN